MVATVVFLALIQSPGTANLPTYLLASPEVRQHLGLKHETSLKIRGVFERIAELNRGGLMSLEESKKLQEEIRKTPPDTLRQQTADFLNSSQQTRLRQLGFQLAGAWVLNTPWMAKEIGVSDAVVAKVRRVQLRAYPPYEKAVNSNGKMSRQKMTREITRYNRICLDALNTNLTAEQKARLKALKGEPFDWRNYHYDATKSWPAR